MPLARFEGQVAGGSSRCLFKGRPQQKHLRKRSFDLLSSWRRNSQGAYAKLSTEYNEKYGARQASAEQRAALEQVSLLGVRAIDAFARSVALSDPTRPAATGVTQFTPEFRSKVLAQLTALYKSFHNDSEAGLNELISSVLAKPLPKFALRFSHSNL